MESGGLSGFEGLGFSSIDPTFIISIARGYKKERGQRCMRKFKVYKDKEQWLFGLTPEAFLDYIEGVIPKDHLCRLVKEVVMRLDTRAIEDKYSHLGQHTYHPKLMLAVLFFGYAIGVRSSRKLAEKCKSDHFFIYLMQCNQPDFRTVSDFRKNHAAEIGAHFIEVVRIIRELGITKIGKIYIDGSKIKANAAAKRSKDQAEYERWKLRLTEEVSKILKEAETIDNEEDQRCQSDEDQEIMKRKLSDKERLRQEIEAAIRTIQEQDKEKINLTDHDAHHMKSGGSKDIRPGYNCQAAVTEDGIIVAAEAVGEPNDRHQLVPMIEQTELNTGKEVSEAVADSGYGSYANYEYLEEKKINGYVPDNYFQPFKNGDYGIEKNRYHYTNFKYDVDSNSYICPEGKRLKYWKTRRYKTHQREWNHHVYKGIECGSCTHRLSCTKSSARELLIELREPFLQSMRQKLLSAVGRLERLKRSFIIEPVFGHLKFNLGYRHFLLRGLRKVNAEFKLMCIGWNLKKMARLGVTPAMI